MVRIGQKQITVCMACLAGLVIPLEVAAAVGIGLQVPTVPYLVEVLGAGAVAGVLLLLDAASWSLMTSRR